MRALGGASILHADLDAFYASLVVVEPEAELAFLHDLPVDVIWGVGPATKGRLADAGVYTIGPLTATPGRRLESLLGRAVGDKLAALAWSRDPRGIRSRPRGSRRGRSRPSAASRRTRAFGPTLWQLADRIGARLRAKSRPGRTVSVRVRFADPRSVSRSVTLAAPISATAMLAETAEDLLRGVLAKHANERRISLLAIAVSNSLDAPVVQFELPSGLADEARRPGSKRGEMRALADRAVDVVRHRFGWEAVGYASLAAAPARSVPDDFRRLAEKEL